MVTILDLERVDTCPTSLEPICCDHVVCFNMLWEVMRRLAFAAGIVVFCSRYSTVEAIVGYNLSGGTQMLLVVFELGCASLLGRVMGPRAWVLH